MAAPKKPTHVVVHKKFNFARGEKGKKLERLPVDTLLALTDEQAKKLVKRGFVKPIGDIKTLNATKPDEQV